MDLDDIEARARTSLAPLAPADANLAFWGTRSNAGRSLPPYYLVYFLLVKLLNFNDLGRAEKIAFSIPVELDGTTLMVEYRKFGLGIFIKRTEDETIAAEAAKRIRKAVKSAQPYFDALANSAAKGSNLNVTNNAGSLFERLTHFSDCYEEKWREAEARKYEFIKTEMPPSDGISGAMTIEFPAYNLRKEARWHAIAAIEAFYSWTEHVFILIAILNGKIATGEDVDRAAGIEWKAKFELALGIADPKTKQFYDQLILLRKQVRNFVAHGAFGKSGQALSFHSPVGSVPLLLPHHNSKDRFQFGNGVDLVHPEAIRLIHEFTRHLWSREMSPAKIYIDSSLPLILSYANDGTYVQAMNSEKEMTDLVEYLIRASDDAANMDW